MEEALKPVIDKIRKVPQDYLVDFNSSEDLDKIMIYLNSIADEIEVEYKNIINSWIWNIDQDIFDYCRQNDCSLMDYIDKFYLPRDTQKLLEKDLELDCYYYCRKYNLDISKMNAKDVQLTKERHILSRQRKLCKKEYQEHK